MRKADDFSTEHFEWLVTCRSRNQRSTLTLYKIIEANEQKISQNVVYRLLAQDLTAVAFSLWRAVFLSDLKGDFGDQLASAKQFLQTLIAHNTILYQTDFSTREWTFEYYLDNALFRLRAISEGPKPEILPRDQIGPVATSAKDIWINMQNALDAAVANFGEAIDAQPHE